MIVSFHDFELVPRYDGIPWTQIKIYESSLSTGPWVLIDTQAIPPTTDPADPQSISFTTDLATLDVGVGWYRVDFVDDQNNTQPTDPIFNEAPIEIMANLDDVNAHLDGEVIEATADNSNLAQVSVARVIRGYLSTLFDAPTLMSWDTPETTPSTIREIASMLIAAQVYFNLAARQSLDINNDNYGQRLYDEAMKMLQMILDGIIILEEAPTPGTGPSLSDLDYFPVDDTDRAFTMSMEL